MPQFFWIPWRLPKLNELLDQRGRVFRKSSGSARASKAAKPVAAQANGYSVMKKQWEGNIALLARARGFSVLPGCWDFTYLWIEPDTAFDPSNICAAGVKFIEDSLQENKKQGRECRMEDDGWGTVHSITNHYCLTSEAPGLIPGALMAVDNKITERSALIEQAGRMIHAERVHRRQRTVHATAERAVRGELPSGDQPVGEAPAGSPAPAGARVRAKRATEDGGGAPDRNPGDR